MPTQTQESGFAPPNPGELGLPAPATGALVAVAMSGGVDSSVVAVWLKEAGYRVVGFTLQLYNHAAARGRKGACCAGADIHDARRVAARFDIPHYVLDYEARFKRAVIDDFAAEYAAGRTPVPCARCNERVKFRDLLTLARDVGAEALATGHYVRRRRAGADFTLARAADAGRDQSYFLFAMTQAQLDFTCFPLGDWQKEDVRAFAEARGLPVADKPDSQDICFVPEGRYFEMLERLNPKTTRRGSIEDMSGARLGRHAGIHRFTTGQRRGLGLGTHPTHKPLYVLGIDKARARVVVGPAEAARVRNLRLRDVNWLGASNRDNIYVRLRSTQTPVRARIARGEENTASVCLDTPQAAVAPGQACVFYATGDASARLLGGGWIHETDVSRRVQLGGRAEEEKRA